MKVQYSKEELKVFGCFISIVNSADSRQDKVPFIGRSITVIIFARNMKSKFTTDITYAYSLDRIDGYSSFNFEGFVENGH